jgi:hypothetical protein
MKPAVAKPQRCAIYTRKSSEHKLDLEFNSLDAQSEACEAYITPPLPTAPIHTEVPAPPFQFA